MFKNFVFVLFLVSLVSCVERDVYRIRRHEVIEQVGVVPAPAVITETEIISEPREVIVPERVIVRRHGRRIIVRP